MDSRYGVEPKHGHPNAPEYDRPDPVQQQIFLEAVKSFDIKFDEGLGRDTFLPEHSRGVERIADAIDDIWSAAGATREGDIALSADALDGTDIWFEARLPRRLFISDRLLNAMKAAGEKLGLKERGKVLAFQRVRIVEDSGAARAGGG
jgi:hypothetical protein